MICFSGRGRDWYQALYELVMSDGVQVDCRQGVGIELSSPLHIEIPPGNSNLESLAVAIVQRRLPEQQRVAFSVAHGIQKFLGLPEIYLSKKFPILKRYIRPEEELDVSRISFYMRERLPNHIVENSPWIENIRTESGEVSAIDQLHHAYHLLKNARSTRRAYVDFNEGYKPRCVSSWQFIIRDNNLHMFQNVRSNDLLVGLPNDIISARICQIIMANMLNISVGTLHHHASIVQIYTPDCAGIDAIKEFSNINFMCAEDHEKTIISNSSLCVSFLNYIKTIEVESMESKFAINEVRGKLGSILRYYIDGDSKINEL